MSLPLCFFHIFKFSTPHHSYAHLPVLNLRFSSFVHFFTNFSISLFICHLTLAICVSLYLYPSTCVSPALLFHSICMSLYVLVSVSLRPTVRTLNLSFSILTFSVHVSLQRRRCIDICSHARFSIAPSTYSIFGQLRRFAFASVQMFV